MSLLDDHVRRFNDGIRSGDFSPMIAGFAENAELRFEGVPVGPFAGREAIEAAYREQPPDDEVEILGARERGTASWSPATRGSATRAPRRARCS